MTFPGLENGILKFHDCGNPAHNCAACVALDTHDYDWHLLWVYCSPVSARRYAEGTEEIHSSGQQYQRWQRLLC